MILDVAELPSSISRLDRDRMEIEQQDELEQMLLVFADAETQMEERAESVTLGDFTPIVTTAIGTGIVIWVLHASQAAAAIVSTASAWGQLDPLAVLKDASSTTDEEEALFDEPQAPPKS